MATAALNFSYGMLSEGETELQAFEENHRCRHFTLLVRFPTSATLISESGLSESPHLISTFGIQLHSGIFSRMTVLVALTQAT
ncbi:hypothetical protein ANCCAN_24093 [Ancylostoma caninum]|uniref:Uncharacterized protein n=1 Tax=Ancylostoma caninum TaxID=29170 RepID=A0A368FDJ3_ANCCA|nr:hypothetical protein ANCCAN_24093 [Ancylostoma caninum]